VSGGILVGGEPTALLSTSSALHEVAYRTDNVGRALATALAPAATTVLAATPFAPVQARAVYHAVTEVLVNPAAGLGMVAVAFERASLELRFAGQALEAAGAATLLAAGGLGLLRGQRPTVLASTDGVDLRREVATGGGSLGLYGATSSLGVREVRRPDGSTFYVVEMTTGAKAAASIGVQVNGVGGYAESAAGPDVTMRWAVPTRHDAELLIAMASAALIPEAGKLLRGSLPMPTEAGIAVSASAAVVGGIALVPGTSASGTAAVRNEVTVLRSGAQRFATSIRGSGQLGLASVAGTGGAGAVKVAVDRSPGGAVTKVSLSTSTEVDRGRHGQPLLEAGNREATLTERDWEVQLTPEHRAAADRIATSVAGGSAPARADVERLADAVRGTSATVRTYDVRHQAASGDVGVEEVNVGLSGSVDTADLRQP